jgi:hypothetical protein
VRGKLDPVADDLATLDRQWEDEVVRFTAAGLENAAANGA